MAQPPSNPPPNLTSLITLPNPLIATKGSPLSDIFRATLQRYDSEGRPMEPLEVAVKQIRGVMVPDPEKRRLKQEISVWKRTNHPNLLPLLGICDIDGHALPAMVSAWAENGNLDFYLRELTKSGTAAGVVNATRLRLLKDVARGLKDLHDHRIVHADIKPENVLVAGGSDPNKTSAKLCDFGLSWTDIMMTIAFSHPRYLAAGTREYMAPELLAARDNADPGIHLYSPATDVWAFGCLISSVFGDDKTPSISNGVLVIPPTLPQHLHQVVRFCCVIGGVRPPVSDILAQLDTLG